MEEYFMCFCKQKTAYEMRISDCSSDVCSSDLLCDGFVVNMSAFAPRDEHWQDTDRQHSSDVIAPKAPHAIPQAVSLLITPHQHFPNHSAIGPLQDRKSVV